MIVDATLGMINNAALLLSLGVLYYLFPLSPHRWMLRRRVFVGIVIGLMGIALMLTRWQLLPGLIFDTRTILLSTAGLFFGAIPTLIGVALTTTFRIVQGGIGTLTGVATIVSSAGIGLLWRRFRYRWDRPLPWWELLLLGFFVHIVMLACMLLLPWSMAKATLEGITLPVLTVYPLGTMLLGKLVDYQRSRFRVQRHVQASERRLSAMLEHAWGVISLLDENGTITYASDSLKRIFGYRPEEVRGKAFVDFVHPEDRERAWVRFMRAREMGGQPFELEARLKAASGEWMWTETVGTNLLHDPAVNAIVFNSRDVTERHRAAVELARERNLLQQITETSPVAITVVDTSGRITFANSFARETLDLRESDLADRTYDSPSWEITTFSGDPFPPGELPFNRVMSTGKIVRNVRHTIRRTDGTRAYLQIHSAPLRSDEGEISGMVSVIEDITEKELMRQDHAQVEAQLRQSQKMEAVGRLAGGVAHDFNNMLAVIMSTAEMALLEVEPETELHDDLLEIDRAAKRSAELTRQLLAFSRRQVIQPEALHLNRLLEDRRRVLQRLIGEDVRLVVHAQDDLWPVFNDPSQIDQIITNLLVNARDAIGGVGEITVELKNEHLGPGEVVSELPASEGDFVRLTVTDNGAGMDEATQERIFEPFFTTKSSGEGTGLGLATVYGIVQQNEGMIEVESTPGEGSRFIIYLPRHTGEAKQREIEGGIGFAAGSETVLVVEDEDAVLRLATRFLEKMGYTVLGANNPDIALERARAHKGDIDLMLTDVVMPGMNGKDLEKKIREIIPDIRVLFMSGYTADVIAQRGVLEAEIDFIHKPFTMRTLGEKVRTVLDWNRSSGNGKDNAEE